MLFLSGYGRLEIELNNKIKNEEVKVADNRILEMSPKFGKWLCKSIEEFATENGLRCELWHQGAAVFYVKAPYGLNRIVQITAFGIREGSFLCFIPHHNRAAVVKEDFGNLEQLLKQNKTRELGNLVKEALSKAWENETS